MYYYSGSLAKAELNICFKYRDTAKWYEDDLKTSLPNGDMIIIPEKDVFDWMTRWDVHDASYAEYVISCSYVCDALLKKGKAVVHGASMLWNGSAYLFSAPSGTGKTTQIRMWKALFPDETEILNGDKPILETTQQGEAVVHPSPWKGKEGYGRDDITAPLAGIIMLRQASENSIERMKPGEAARILFPRICSTFNTEEEVENSARILENILTAVPVWLLSNKGDEDSVRITQDALMRAESDFATEPLPELKDTKNEYFIKSSGLLGDDVCGRRYRLKEGVCLFSIFGQYFIFPTRKAEGLVSFILTASRELAEVLQENRWINENKLSEETSKKIKRLVAAGFAEEY